MCFGGGSAGSTAPPPPSNPTTFGEVPDNTTQRNHNSVVRQANADTVNSTTMGQVGSGAAASGGSFGSELGRTAA